PPSFFYGHLPPYRVKWVDNYYGSILLSGVGGPITGAAPDGGKFVFRSHSGVHDFYHDTISVGSTEGFAYSCLLPGFDTPGNRPPPTTWSTQQPLTQVLSSVLKNMADLLWYTPDN